MEIISDIINTQQNSIPAGIPGIWESGNRESGNPRIGFFLTVGRDLRYS